LATLDDTSREADRPAAAVRPPPRARAAPSSGRRPAGRAPG